MSIFLLNIWGLWSFYVFLYRGTEKEPEPWRRVGGKNTAREQEKFKSSEKGPFAPGPARRHVSSALIDDSSQITVRGGDLLLSPMRGPNPGQPAGPGRWTSEWGPTRERGNKDRDGWR